MNPTDPAFPVPPMTPKHQGGMDLRTYMATHILQGFMSATDPTDCPKFDDLADDAVRLADALIARLNAKP